MRNISSAILDLLTSNGPFAYCHLVKFQRPYLSTNVSPLVDLSTNANKYAYISDASFDVVFDDGSLNSAGSANGPQTYFANKLLDISSIQESTEARVNNITLTLDGLALGGSVSGSITVASLGGGIYSITVPSTEYLTELGFKEGDKVSLSGLSIASNGDYVIRSFLGDNVLRVVPIDITPATGTATGLLSQTSDELMGILSNKSNPNYVSYKNREVQIYRAYMNADTMAIVGTPVLMFKGLIINGGSVNQDSSGSVKVQWSVSSHWGDFLKVNGRLTSDPSHRALSSGGIPQPAAAKKTEYAYDKGFNHSETTVNTLATYKVDVEKQNIKFKKGFLGFGGKVKVTTYTVQEDRQVGLNFNLGAQYIPIVYGIRATPGIPVFADTLVTNPSYVYMANVLSEGPIGGIFDLYVNSSSLICSNDVDFTSRNTSITTLSAGTVLCRGRADRGDVLGSTSVTTATNVAFYSTYSAYIQNRGVNPLAYMNYNAYADVATEATNSLLGAGVFDGQGILISTPISVSVDLYSGRDGQKAASNLVTIAKAENFKIQKDYWATRESTEYWGPNHRLVDSAYAVNKYIITSTDASVPDVSYVVRGKLVECYNYDFSYLHDPAYPFEASALFPLGDTVDVYNAAGTLLDTGVKIVDKWDYTSETGTVMSRIRLGTRPSLGYNTDNFPSTTSFYIQKGTDKWHMLTFNHVFLSETIPSLIEAGTISSISSNSGKLRINFSGTVAADATIVDSTSNTAFFKVTNSDYTSITSYTELYNLLLSGTFGSNYLDTVLQYADYQKFATAFVGKKVVSATSIKTTSTPPVAATKLTIQRQNSTGDISYFKTSISYLDTANKVTFCSAILPIDFIPKSGDTIKYSSNGDTRVSINPSLQLMDYISSKTYGANTDLEDLDMGSWLTTARQCDGRADVTVKITSGSISTTAINSVWNYVSTGLKFEGTVSAVTNTTNGYYVTFTNVIGKLTNKWKSWKAFPVGALVYNSVGTLYRVTTSQAVSTEPTHTTGTVSGLLYISSAVLTKTAGTGPSTITMDFSLGNPVANFENGAETSGYSLYDSDDVDYWRYLGWDSDEQRNVTKFQTNILLDTSQPVFDNINSFLGHFDGILRQENGKYILETEVFNPTPTGYFDISQNNIIGDINITDAGSSNAYNSISVSFADPANKFDARAISFYNSTYLAQDNGIPKKGTLTIPGTTNYLNARMAAEKALIRSRYGLSISFTMEPFGIAYTPGTIFAVTYPKFGWVSKLFICEGLTLLMDTLVSISATEIDASLFYKTSVAGGKINSGNFINLPSLGSLATKSSVSWNSDIDSRPANLASLTGTEGIITNENTSLDTYNVDGVPASQVIDNIETNTQELIRNNTLDVINRSVQDNLNYTGTGDSTQLVALTAQAQSTTSLNKIDLIGAVNSGGTAFILNSGLVTADGSTNLATFLSLVSSVVGTGSVTISDLRTAVDGQEGRVTIVIDANGNVTGLDFGTSSTPGSGYFDIISPRFRLIDPTDPLNIKVPLQYVSGQLTFTSDVVINGNVIVNGTVTTTQLGANSVTNYASATIGSFTNIGNETTIATVVFNPLGGRVQLNYSLTSANPGSTRYAIRIKVFKDGTNISGSMLYIGDDSFATTCVNFIFDETGTTANATYTISIQTVTGTSIGDTGGTPYAANLQGGRVAIETFKR